MMIFNQRALCLWFEKALLGGADQVDHAAFESVWSNIKGKYVSEVRT